MRLQHEYDMHAAGESIQGGHDGMKPRTKIVEIVACHDLVFTLSHSGVCTAFNRGESLSGPPPLLVLAGFTRVGHTLHRSVCVSSVAVGSARTPRDGS